MLPRYGDGDRDTPFPSYGSLYTFTSLSVSICWNPEYRKASECKERSSSRMKVSVPAHLAVPERCLYRYLGTVKESNGI